MTASDQNASERYASLAWLLPGSQEGAPRPISPWVCLLNLLNGQSERVPSA
jgi:hypothetical protein